MTEPACAVPGTLAFANLSLHPATLATLSQLGWQQMTAVQSATLPAALAGHDLLVQSPTGSGKTAAFALTLLERLNPRRFAVQALVLCPTRELADQVASEIRRLARGLDNVKVLTLCGGVAVRGQVTSLAHGAHIVVGTPGRVRDLLAREALKLDALTLWVLDEADRMLDMGFLPDIQALAHWIPAPRQTLLWSATYPDGVAQLAQQFMHAPQHICITAPAARPVIEQHHYAIDPAQRAAAVVQLLQHFRPARTLAFCNTRQACNALVEALRQQGLSALALHGDLPQRERDQVLALFAGDCLSVLVATDVAARGIDIESLQAVINVELSPDPLVHTHRIGRTARAGKSGLALNLASPREREIWDRAHPAQAQAVQWEALPEGVATDHPPLQPARVMLQILAGRKDKLRPADVLGALTAGAVCQRDQIGKITVTEFTTLVAVQRDAALLALQQLQDGTVKGRRVKARLL